MPCFRRSFTDCDITPLPEERGNEPARYGVMVPAERSHLRAEIDGIVARLYRLTEAEFAHMPAQTLSAGG